MSKGRLTLLLMVALSVPPSLAVLKVPTGFEELAEGQVIWLEVSLYGRALGLFQARVDLDTVRFSDPAGLAGAIRDKYNRSPALYAMLLAKLATPLARNGHLACGDVRAAGCGYTDTNDAAVIYDENNARVSLFLDKEYLYLSEKKEEDRFYQETRESFAAFIHQQNLNVVADRNYQSASLQGNGTLGITDNGYANVDWSWQGQRYRSLENQRVDFNNLYVRQDLWKRFYVQGGMMDQRDIFGNLGGSITLSQLPLDKIRGIRIGSTLAWFNPEKASRGTPVSVFLSQDARVDAYLGDRLLSSFYLRAGAQELDTHSFPPGSYMVTLRVFENNQLVRAWQTPYTGTGSTPLNTFQWFLQGGNLVNNDRPGTEDNHRVVQGGFRFPVTQTLSLTAGSTVLSNASYQEMASDWAHTFSTGPLNGVLTSRISYLYGTDGSRGNIQQVNYSDGVSLSFYRTQMVAPDCNNSASKRYSYQGCYQSLSTMLSAPVGDWYASLAYSQSNNEGRYIARGALPVDDPQHNGAPWSQVWTARSHSRSWQAGMSRAFTYDALTVSTSLNAFMRRDSGYEKDDRGVFLSVNLSGFSRRGGESVRSATTLGARYQNSRRGSEQLGYSASYNRYMDDSGENELGVSLDGVNTQTVSASAMGRAGGRYGRGALTLSDTFGGTGTHTLNGSGNYSSALLIDRHGLAWGRWGDGIPSSAITVDVTSPDEDASSAVSVALNTGGKADIKGKGRVLFSVPGYREVMLNITESSDARAGVGSEISRGAGSRTLFMTPGRVFNHDISTSARYTWFGKMTDEQQRPLEGGIPLNVLSWSPLGNGGFTLETGRLVKTLYIMRDDTFWQCSMHVKSVRDVVRYVGTTTCSRTALSALPAPEQKQVGLMATRTGSGRATVARND